MNFVYQGMLFFIQKLSPVFAQYLYFDKIVFLTKDRFHITLDDIFEFQTIMFNS